MIVTRARWSGLVVIVLWLLAGLGWFPFGALSAFLPPVSMLYWTVVGLPVCVLTWLWLRPARTETDRWIMIAGGGDPNHGAAMASERNTPA